jgi:hypothetical protein
MNDVIAKMRAELRGVLKASVAAYPGQPRDKWLFDWPSQVILWSTRFSGARRSKRCAQKAVACLSCPVAPSLLPLNRQLTSLLSPDGSQSPARPSCLTLLGTPQTGVCRHGQWQAERDAHLQ